MSAAVHPPLIASLPSDTPPDVLEMPDALAGNSQAVNMVPLTPGSPNTPSPLKYDDALDRTTDTLGGATPGNHMPTVHSHWLKGSIFNARVQVRLNGLYLGSYSAPQDRDITMKLRAGMNTITLTYQPLTSTASAHLDVLESEHDPPIPPIATFRSPRMDDTSHATATSSTTQTLTFLAR